MERAFYFDYLNVITERKREILTAFQCPVTAKIFVYFRDFIVHATETATENFRLEYFECIVICIYSCAEVHICKSMVTKRLFELVNERFHFKIFKYVISTKCSVCVCGEV